MKHSTLKSLKPCTCWRDIRFCIWSRIASMNLTKLYGNQATLSAPIASIQYHYIDYSNTVTLVEPCTCWRDIRFCIWSRIASMNLTKLYGNQATLSAPIASIQYHYIDYSNTVTLVEPCTCWRDIRFCIWSWIASMNLTKLYGNQASLSAPIASIQ